MFEDGFGEKGDADAEEAAGNGEEQCFTETRLDDVETGESESLKDANFAGALEDHGVHVHQDDEETYDDAEADHGFDEGFQFGEIGGVHERDVFGHGANAILRIELQDFGAGGFGVALAADENHGNVIFRADDVLPGFQGNEKARAFAVGNNAGDGEGMIDESDGVADFDVAGVGGGVVGGRLLGGPGGGGGGGGEKLAEGGVEVVIA